MKLVIAFAVLFGGCKPTPLVPAFCAKPDLVGGVPIEAVRQSFKDCAEVYQDSPCVAKIERTSRTAFNVTCGPANK